MIVAVQLNCWINLHDIGCESLLRVVPGVIGPEETYYAKTGTGL